MHLYILFPNCWILSPLYICIKDTHTHTHTITCFIANLGNIQYRSLIYIINCHFFNINKYFYRKIIFYCKARVLTLNKIKRLRNFTDGILLIGNLRHLRTWNSRIRTWLMYMYVHVHTLVWNYNDQRDITKISQGTLPLDSWNQTLLNRSRSTTIIMFIGRKSALYTQQYH